jgi:hypothetical protein
VGDVLGHHHALDEAIVRIAALIGGRAGAADVLQSNVADVQD